MFRRAFGWSSTEDGGPSASSSSKNKVYNEAAIWLSSSHDKSSDLASLTAPSLTSGLSGKTQSTGVTSRSNSSGQAGGSKDKYAERAVWVTMGYGEGGPIKKDESKSGGISGKRKNKKSSKREKKHGKKEKYIVKKERMDSKKHNGTTREEDTATYTTRSTASATKTHTHSNTHTHPSTPPSTHHSSTKIDEPSSSASFDAYIKSLRQATFTPNTPNENMSQPPSTPPSQDTHLITSSSPKDGSPGSRASSESDTSTMVSSVTATWALNPLNFPELPQLVERTLSCPPGQLQIIIDDCDTGPVISKVSVSSPMAGLLFPGDRLLAVDELDVRGIKCESVKDIMSQRSHLDRFVKVLSVIKIGDYGGEKETDSRLQSELSEEQRVAAALKMKKIRDSDDGMRKQKQLTVSGGPIPSPKQTEEPPTEQEANEEAAAMPEANEEPPEVPGTEPKAHREESIRNILENTINGSTRLENSANSGETSNVDGVEIKARFDSPVTNDSAGTDISQRRIIFAPPGKVGIVLRNSDEGPRVHTVRPNSVLKDEVEVGDLIIELDNIDTSAMKAKEVTKLMGGMIGQERRLTLFRPHKEKRATSTVSPEGNAASEKRSKMAPDIILPDLDAIQKNHSHLGAPTGAESSSKSTHAREAREEVASAHSIHTDSPSREELSLEISADLTPDASDMSASAHSIHTDAPSREELSLEISADLTPDASDMSASFHESSTVITGNSIRSGVILARKGFDDDGYDISLLSSKSESEEGKSTSDDDEHGSFNQSKTIATLSATEPSPKARAAPSATESISSSAPRRRDGESVKDFYVRRKQETAPVASFSSPKGQEEMQEQAAVEKRSVGLSLTAKSAFRAIETTDDVLIRAVGTSYDIPALSLGSLSSKNRFAKDPSAVHSDLKVLSKLGNKIESFAGKAIPQHRADKVHYLYDGPPIESSSTVTIFYSQTSHLFTNAINKIERDSVGKSCFVMLNNLACCLASQEDYIAAKDTLLQALQALLYGRRSKKADAQLGPLLNALRSQFILPLPDNTNYVDKDSQDTATAVLIIRNLAKVLIKLLDYNATIECLLLLCDFYGPGSVINALLQADAMKAMAELSLVLEKQTDAIESYESVVALLEACSEMPPDTPKTSFILRSGKIEEEMIDILDILRVLHKEQKNEIEAVKCLRKKIELQRGLLKTRLAQVKRY